MNTSHPQIVKRLVTIPFSAAATVDWMKDNSDYKNSLNAVSFTFPVGERYFVKSVNFYMDRIVDPELKERTRCFMYQEAMHAKEHDRANKFLLEVYPHGRVLERMTKKLLEISRFCKPRSTQLATTCALEHFTAIMAHALLNRQEEFIVHSEPAYANFWLWHAVEESEHKAVCFDVYEHLFGKGLLSYLHRIAVMTFVSFFFFVSLGTAFGIINLKQKFLRFRDRFASKKTKQFESTGNATLTALFRGVTPSMYFDYFRPSFHPLNIDSKPLIEKWKSRYAEFGLGPQSGDATEVKLPDDFDAQVYLRLHPDVAQAQFDAVEHYLRHGHQEGRVYRNTGN